MASNSQNTDQYVGNDQQQKDISTIEYEHSNLIDDKCNYTTLVRPIKSNITESLLSKECIYNVVPDPDPVTQPSCTLSTIVENNINKQKSSELSENEITTNKENYRSGSSSNGQNTSNSTEIDDNVYTQSTWEVKNYDPTIDERLPETVTLLTTADGGKLYLVGTAHFSVESQNDVSKVTGVYVCAHCCCFILIIRAVQPHMVVVELCKARVGILQLDEKTMFNYAKNINYKCIMEVIKKEGVYNGLLQILLLKMAAHVAKELGMPPGGEFRRAFEEAKMVPNCIVHMADRPINITMQRALRALSWWQTIKLGWHLIFKKGHISQEDVEICKQRSMLDGMIAKIKGEFPVLGEVFVKERDTYLTYSLQMACMPICTNVGSMPARVVGIVGLGHIPGIIENWDTITKGFGLVTTKIIKKGQFVCEYAGEVISLQEARCRIETNKKNNTMNYVLVVREHYGDRTIVTCIDPKYFGIYGIYGTQTVRIPPPSLSGRILKLTVKVSILSAAAYTLAVSMEASASSDEYEHVLADVMYVVNNIPGPGIDIVDFESVYSVGCSCTIECYNCTCTRGSANYSENQIIDGRLMGPVFECNSRCECKSNCGNRLVQNGPLNCLIVREIVGKGFGLVTTKIIKKGQFVCEYAGEVISLQEARCRIETNKKNNTMNYVLVVREHYGDRTIVTCIDPKYFGNIGRYANHSCDPNCSLVPVRVDSIVPRLCLFASRNIKNEEEVTIDYAGGLMANSVHCLSDTPCFCNSNNCFGYLPHNPI